MARIDCLEFKRISKGMTSSWRDHAGIVVRTTKKLKWVWDRFYKDSLDPPDPPEVDFAKVMWICSFRGEYSTWGYPTEIQRIVQAYDGHNTFLLVHVLELNPSRRKIVKQEFSQPFHIVEMDRSEMSVHFRYKQKTPWR